MVSFSSSLGDDGREEELGLVSSAEDMVMSVVLLMVVEEIWYEQRELVLAGCPWVWVGNRKGGKRTNRYLERL